MPATAGAIRAGRAFVEAFLDDSKLVRGLRSAQRRLKRFGASVSMIGAATVGVGAALATPFVVATGAFVKAGDALDKMSRRTGVSVEALSELQFAASQSGTSSESLEKGLRGMQRTLLDAERGLSTAVDNLNDLGLSLKDLQGLTPQQQFAAFAEKLSQIEDPSRRAALAMKIFGRSGAELLPMMESGAEGIESLMHQARELGLTMSTEDAQAAAALGDAWDALWRVAKRGVVAVGAALAPTLIDYARRATAVLVTVVQWIDTHRDLIVTAAKVVVGIIAVGAALVALGTGIIVAGAVLGGLATILTTVGTVLGAVATAIGFLVSPIGLAIAAAVALGVWFVKSSGVAATAIGFLSDVFGTLKADTLVAFEAIRNALSGGDIAAAAKVLWSLLKLEWARGVGFLTQKWLEAKSYFLEVWAGLTTRLAKLWVEFTTLFQIGWRKAQQFVAEGILELIGLFDESLDVDAAKGELQRQAEADIIQIDNRGRQTLGELYAMAEQDRAAREERFDRDIADSRRAVEDAQAEFDRAVREGNAAGAKADSTESGELPPWLAGLLDSLDGGIGAAGQHAQAAGGTFSSLSARMFADREDDIEREQLDALRLIEKHTGKLVSNGALTFAP